MRGRWPRRHVVVVAALSVAAALAWQLTPVAPERADASAAAPIASFDDLRVRASDSVILPPPDDFGAPADAPAAPPAKLRVGNVVPSGGTWAVVIGVNDYPGARYDLDAAVNDADAVVTALSGMGVPSGNILALRDRQVNSGTIAMATDWLVAHAAPDAVAVFFYAGHVRKVGSGRESMVGSNGTLFSDAELAAKLTRLQARRAWIAIAGCYGGGFTEVLAPGRVLTGASPANKLTYENTALGNSYMVEYMVQRAMTDQKAPTSVQASFNWARDQLARDYPDRLPVQFDRGSGLLDLRPLSAGPRPPAKAAPAPSGGSGGSGGGSGGGSSSPTGGSPLTNPPSTPPRGEDGCTVNALGVRVC